MHTKSRHEYSLNEERFGVKGERSQQESRDGVMLGFRFQHQTFIAWEFSVLHLLNLPLTYTQNNTPQPQDHLTRTQFMCCLQATFILHILKFGLFGVI